MICPRCGAGLKLQTSQHGHHFWGCTRFRRGCRFGFAATPDGRPIRASVHDAPDRAAEILEVKDRLLVLAEERLPRGRTSYQVRRDANGEVDESGPWDFWRMLGAICLAEDLVTLGELRAELDALA